MHGHYRPSRNVCAPHERPTATSPTTFVQPKRGRRARDAHVTSLIGLLYEYATSAQTSRATSARQRRGASEYIRDSRRERTRALAKQQMLAGRAAAAAAASWLVPSALGQAQHAARDTGRQRAPLGSAALAAAATARPRSGGVSVASRKQTWQESGWRRLSRTAAL